MDAEAIEAQVRRVRESGALGRSPGLLRLFDHLAAHAGRPLSEADIAAEIFGRSVDLPGDASVRVYVHRLRRKLEAFYAGPGRDEPRRLVIPIGEYRLELQDGRPTATPVSLGGRRLWPWALAAFVLAANLAAWAWVWGGAAPVRELARVVAEPLWAGLGRERPVLVVVGDYYIFGDTEGGGEPRRMIREFDVNAPADLDAFLMAHPQLQGRYVDLDTYYTPVGATLALREIMPLVRQAAGDAERARLITSSQLTPAMLKEADIVYVGYLSGLRVLQELVFARSRFEIGATYDELVDRRTGQVFVSGAGAAPAGRPNRDLGYLAAFQGPAGNRFVIVAGARDIGVMQAAEIAADRGRLRRLGGAPLEVLYQVEGVGRTNVSAAPVAPAP